MRNRVLTCMLAASCIMALAGCSGEPNNKLVVLQKTNSSGTKDTARCVADTPNKDTYAQVEKCAKSFEDKGYSRTETQ